jgi:hypothetical protein
MKATILNASIEVGIIKDFYQEAHEDHEESTE